MSPNFDPKVSDVTWNPDRLGWLGLACFEGFGSKYLARISSYIQDGAAAWAINQENLEKLGIPTATCAKFMDFRKSWDQDAMRLKLETAGIEFCLQSDEAYPPLLRHIPDRPFALFIRGRTDWPDICVGMVGTRNCTAYGRRVAQTLGHELSQAGLGIISGLALGIDAAAHEAALEKDGRCIAVLGSGCDDEAIYPRSNFRLAQRILEAGGCLVSELPPGTPGLKFHFPLRNRIIAGMSRAIVVVEAGLDSGSLITANLALDYNRDVLAVPGPIDSLVSLGTNKLLRLGAIPCTGAADILEQLGQTTSPVASRLTWEELGVEDQNFLAQLQTPQHIDELTRILKLPIAEVLQRLAALEIAGCVLDQGGKNFVSMVAQPSAEG